MATRSSNRSHCQQRLARTWPRPRRSRGAAAAPVPVAAASEQTSESAASPVVAARPAANTPTTPIAQPAATASIVRLVQQEKTQNRTVLDPDMHKIAEDFNGEDALEYYLAAFTDEEIVARLRRRNRDGNRRVVSFVEIPS